MVTKKKPAKKPAARKKPAQPKIQPIRFAYAAPDAQHVALAGDFNNWDPQAQPMQRGADGTWSVSLSLQPGTYQYKFVVDGDWREDHANPSRTWDAQGLCNSVIEVA